MSDYVSDEDMAEAIQTLYRYFVQENNKEPVKPITMVDTEITDGDQKFRIISHFSFYGRNEKISYKKEE